MPTKDHRLGAPKDEIEITPEMIEAGEEVARRVAEDEWGMMLRCDDPKWLLEFVVCLYRTMAAAKLDSPIHPMRRSSQG